MKSKIILILVISSLIIGCVDAPKSENIIQKQFISEDFGSQFKDFGSQFKLDQTLQDCSRSKTTIQCDEFVNNNINGKYVRWSGKILDVKENEIIVSGYSIQISIPETRKEELSKYNKGDTVTYTAKIYVKKNMVLGYSLYPGAYSLENIEIEQPTQSSIKSNVQSGIVPTVTDVVPIIPPQIGIAYHIDTLPPGKGVVYINNKISPTTGTLPPGSYNIKLVVGSKTYESTMSAVEGGSIELIQPV